ncbi:MAG: fructose-bisphosphate aldolase, class [Microbacteriaceae bacterium]|nr:fructose-bisphosphate aldolase, class [Microbacteriaceae bacterium]
MPVVSSLDLFSQSIAEKRSIAAFNVITLEHAEGIIAGAETAQLPVILQLSENAIRYHGSAIAIARATAAVAEASSVDVALHLDHITDVKLMHLAPELAFSSVMFDASKHDYADNVELTRQAVQWGAAHGIWIEAELGEVGGKDGAHAPGVRTDPQEAAEFVRVTGVDALAVAVGSSHAMTSKDASLDHALIVRLHEALKVPLVLHGSSGVPDSEITQAASEGMVKINIGTALNVVYTGAVRSFLLADVVSSDPRTFLRGGRVAVANTVTHYLKVIAGR